MNLPFASILFLFSFAAAAQSAGAPSNLLEHSPFLPPGYGKQPSSAPVVAPRPVTAPRSLGIEYRGVVQLRGDLLVSLHDLKSDQQQWVRVGESAFGATVASVSEERGEVDLRQGGQCYTLALSTLDDAPLAISSAQPTSIASADSGHQQLKPYSSLSPAMQQGLYDPKFIPVLEQSGVEVPAALRQQALYNAGNRGANASSGSEAGSAQADGNNNALAQQQTSKVAFGDKPTFVLGYDPTPKINNALTPAEKAARAQ